jgi:hypothetical protein
MAPTAQKPVYTIGVIFPNATVVKGYDPSLGNMIITSDLAIKLAAENIKQKNILPGSKTAIYQLMKKVAHTEILLDVELNFTRFYSDETNPGKTAWATVNMIENGVK